MKAKFDRRDVKAARIRRDIDRRAAMTRKAGFLIDGLSFRAR